MSGFVPEIVIFYAIDGEEMDNYLSEEMAQIIEYPLTISHKRIEDIEYNFEGIYENILKSNAIIVILSKEFLNTITVLANAVFQLTKLFNPYKTILMFYGCRESDLYPNHRYLLCGYRAYHRIVSTHSHVKQFVINTIKLLQNILQLNNFNTSCFVKKRYRFSNTPEFELSVDKVYEVWRTDINLCLSVHNRHNILKLLGVWFNSFAFYFETGHGWPPVWRTYRRKCHGSIACASLSFMMVINSDYTKWFRR